VDGAWWSFLETVRARVVVEFRVEAARDEKNGTEEGGRGKGQRQNRALLSYRCARRVSPLIHIARFRLEGFLPRTRRGYNTRIPSSSVTRVTRVNTRHSGARVSRERSSALLRVVVLTANPRTKRETDYLAVISREGSPAGRYHLAISSPTGYSDRSRTRATELSPGRDRIRESGRRREQPLERDRGRKQWS